jgi:hypothetical protein
MIKLLQPLDIVIKRPFEVALQPVDDSHKA